MGTRTSTPVVVPHNVFEGLEAVRQSGLTNMLHTSRVAELARADGFEATYQWLQDSKNSAAFVRGVFNGVEPDADETFEISPPRAVSVVFRVTVEDVEGEATDDLAIEKAVNEINRRAKSYPRTHGIPRLAEDFDISVVPID